MAGKYHWVQNKPDKKSAQDWILDNAEHNVKFKMTKSRDGSYDIYKADMDYDDRTRHIRRR